MFDWFKNIGRREYPTDIRTDMEKIGNDMSKVIPFPVPEVVPPKEETWLALKGEEVMA